MIERQESGAGHWLGYSIQNCKQPGRQIKITQSIIAAALLQACTNEAVQPITVAVCKGLTVKQHVGYTLAWNW